MTGKGTGDDNLPPIARNTTKAGRLKSNNNSAMNGQARSSPGAMIHSAPNLSDKWPTIGSVKKVGPLAATVSQPMHHHPADVEGKYLRKTKPTKSESLCHTFSIRRASL